MSSLISWKDFIVKTYNTTFDLTSCHTMGCHGLMIQGREQSADSGQYIVEGQVLVHSKTVRINWSDTLLLVKTFKKY